MKTRHVFVRLDGTTFVEQVERGAQGVEMAGDPEVELLREFAGRVTTAFYEGKLLPNTPGLSESAHRLFAMSMGRYGWPKRRAR